MRTYVPGITVLYSHYKVEILARKASREGDAEESILWQIRLINAKDSRFLVRRFFVVVIAFIEASNLSVTRDQAQISDKRCSLELTKSLFCGVAA